MIFQKLSNLDTLGGITNNLNLCLVKNLVLG